MRKEVLDAMELAHKARSLLRKGAISLDEAKRMCKTYIDLVNEGGKRMSKEYGNSFKPVSATGFLR